jgi:hypothetical protein
MIAGFFMFCDLCFAIHTRDYDAAFAGDQVGREVIFGFVTVWTLEAANSSVTRQGFGALTFDVLARQQGKALRADFAFRQPDQGHTQMLLRGKSTTPP